MKCEGCLANDCGSCLYCIDMKKFGGLERKKKKRVKRKCTGSTQQVIFFA